MEREKNVYKQHSLAAQKVHHVNIPHSGGIMQERVLVPVTSIHHSPAAVYVTLHKPGVTIEYGVDHVLEGPSGVAFTVGLGGGGEGSEWGWCVCMVE